MLLFPVFLSAQENAKHLNYTFESDLQLEVERRAEQQLNQVQPSEIPNRNMTVCADAIPITEDSFTNRPLVCGTSNDLNADTLSEICEDNGPIGDPIPDEYFSGNEALYVYTPSTNGQIEITVHNHLGCLSSVRRLSNHRHLRHCYQIYH